MGRSPRYRSAQQEPLYVTGRWRWSGPCGHLRPTPIVPRLLHAQYGIPCHAEAGQRLLSGGRTQSRPTGNTRGGLRRCDAAPATPTRQDATAHGGVARLHLRDTALRRPSGHTGLQARPALLPLQLWWRSLPDISDGVESVERWTVHGTKNEGRESGGQAIVLEKAARSKEPVPS